MYLSNLLDAIWYITVIIALIFSSMNFYTKHVFLFEIMHGLVKMNFSDFFNNFKRRLAKLCMFPL